MPWLKISDDLTSLPASQQIAVVGAIATERRRKALASEKGRHRNQKAGVSRRVIGLLSAAVLTGSGIAYMATSYGFLP